MRTLLLTFEDDVERDQYLKLVLKPTPLSESETLLLQKTVETAKFDPPIRPDSERVAHLFVSGQKMAEGLLPAMQARFDQEVGVHSASVELREQRNGEWLVVRKRAKRQS